MVTLYHKELQFFGRTYSGSSLPLSPGAQLNQYDCETPEYVLFYFSLPPAAIQAVLEVVVRAKWQDGTRLVFSVGWCAMELSNDKKDLYAELCGGSPRFLLQPAGYLSKFACDDGA